MKPKLKLVSSHEPTRPSLRFLSLTRNPGLESPSRFEPTKKESGDVII